MQGAGPNTDVCFFHCALNTKIRTQLHAVCEFLPSRYTHLNERLKLGVD